LGHRAVHSGLWGGAQMGEFKGLSLEACRPAVGRFGITGDMQTLAIKHLSDGLKSRVVFAWLAMKTPHMLLLDEPTNHLDLESIDSLAAAIKGAPWLPCVCLSASLPLLTAYSQCFLSFEKKPPAVLSAPKRRTWVLWLVSNFNCRRKDVPQGSGSWHSPGF
jgi:ABC transporter